MPTELESRIGLALERMSREVAPDPTLPPPVRRGVRRRAIATVEVLATAVAVVVTATVAGIRWLEPNRAQPAAVRGGGMWAVGTQGPGSPGKALTLRCW